MTKRTLAALCALLAAASTLAVIAGPAAAHPKTTTKQYCAYDPFAGQQCWTQTVPVAHHHAPANQPCPAGTTGTPPNCLPIPPTNDPAPGTDSTGEPDDTDEPDTNEPEGAGNEPETDEADDTDEPEGGDEPQNACEPWPACQSVTDPEPDTSGDEPENPCEPWPACQSVTDPEPTTTTACVAPGRGPGHKHDGHGCHARTPGHGHGESGSGEDSSGGATGSAYGFANALGKVLNWFDSNKDTLADPPQALTDAAENQATRDAAKAAARFGLDFIENNRHLFGRLTIAQQKALSRAFLDAPPEAQVIITAVSCSALGGGGSLPCSVVLGLSIIHDDKVRPWLRPFSDILLPEDDDTPSSGDSTSDGQHQNKDVDPPSSAEDVDNARDKHPPDLAYARRMCDALPHIDFFCDQVRDSTPGEPAE